MNLRRIPLADGPIETIDRMAGSYFFNSTAFARLWESMGGTPMCLLIYDKDKLLAAMTGIEFGSGKLRWLQSMPNGCYSRVLYEELEYEELLILTNELARALKAFGYSKIYINDAYRCFDNLQGYKSEPCSTQLVEISSPDWQPPDSKLRQQIHKAEKEGIEIVPFSPTQHMSGFMQLVKLHEKRRNLKSLYSQAFFETLADIALKDDRVRWVWCEYDGRPAASSIFFREGISILHWQMYYDETLSHLQATKLIPYVVAKQSAQRGIKMLNLGASPPEAEGAEQYKSKWGGEAFHYNCYTYKNLLGRFW